MNSMKIVGTGKYIPDKKIENDNLEEIYNLDEGYIKKVTGIETRYYVENETLDTIAINSVKDLIEKNSKIEIQKVGIIIATSTTINNVMPSLSFQIQKYFDIKNCMCLDVLAGCSGFINALDIAQKYLTYSDIDYALVIGAEVLSINNYINDKDKILFGDGAGCVLLENTGQEKEYFSLIESISQNNDILTCDKNNNLYMDGKGVYKFATTKTVENINKLIEKADENKENIKYIIPHQSNLKILEKISQKLDIKMYTNIRKYGNTFCASIPIALDELVTMNEIKEKDKIILLGYGGGLNLGSILMEV